MASAAIDREQVKRKGFYEFVKRAWPIVEISQPLIQNWHIEEKCLHCEAVSDFRLRDLLINEPPGMSKSMIVSVLWAPWAWIEKPWLRWIFGSFDGSLALSHAEKSFNLITSNWYRERWGNILKPSSTYAMGEYDTAAGGFRFSTSVAGKGTGRHCHIRVCDDPVKPTEAEGNAKSVSAALETANNWWRNTMGSRRVDPSKFGSVVVMQRIHEADLSQQCIDEGYEHLCFPMRFEPERASRTTIGGDRRTQQGELLHPQRFDERATQLVEAALGGPESMVVASQLQQRPAPPGGLIFKSETFQYFQENLVPFEDAFTVISVDCAFKDAAENDHVAIEAWGSSNAKLYCYESVTENLDLEGTIVAILQMQLRRNANAILIEGKANGPAVISVMRKRLSNIIELDPKTSKTARAHAANVYYQARSVYHLEGAAWLSRKEGNLKNFPKARRDDDVDTTTQAILYLGEAVLADLTQALENFKGMQSTWQNALQDAANPLQRHFSIR